MNSSINEATEQPQLNNSKPEATEEPPLKKSKPDTANGSASEVPASDFSKLEVVRVLSCSDTGTSFALEAKHVEVEGRVLVHMQKTPFDESKLKDIVTGDTKLNQLFHNDVYSKYTAQLPPHLNDVAVTLIHPALDKHFVRYERDSHSVVEETPELYLSATKPFMDSKDAHSKQWIYNILSGESETERVVFRDQDPSTGFTLLPDLKWTGLQMNDLYLLALVERRDLSCIRDLRGEHLPLLRSVRDKGSKAIEEKYGVPRKRLRIYFHYLPSFYHLHIHFSALSFDAPGTRCGKAHMLSNVISNLEVDPLYYEKATLSFTVPDNHPHPLANNNINKDSS